MGKATVFLSSSHRKSQKISILFLQIAYFTDFPQISAIYSQKMDRDEPPPMTNDVKKDIFGDEEDDDDLFKSAIADKVDKIDDLVGGSEITGNLLSVELGDENSNKVDKNDLLGQDSSDTTENLLGVDLIGSDENSNRDEDTS